MIYWVSISSLGSPAVVVKEAMLTTYSGQKPLRSKHFSGALIHSCFSLFPTVLYLLLGAGYSRLVLFRLCTESLAAQSLVTVMVTACTLLSRTLYYIKNQAVPAAYFVYCSFIVFLSSLRSSDLARSTLGSSCFLNYPIPFRKHSILITTCCVFTPGTLF